MVPALTSCPAKRFTPSRCPGEFRPFTDDPPPFLCAIRYYPPRSSPVVGRQKRVPNHAAFVAQKVELKCDVADFNRRVILPMPPLDLVLPARLVLKHRDLPMPSLRHNLARNFSGCGVLARQDLLVV